MILTAPEIEEYQDQGVLLVRNAVSAEWVRRLGDFAGRLTESRSKWMSDTGDVSTLSGQGRALDVRYLWRDNPLIREFVYESNVAALVAQAMQVSVLRFYFDHWFIKEPGEGTSTPWHQDAPYWPFAGKQIASVWLSLTELSPEASPLEFVLGSHRWGKAYRPERFIASDRADSWIEQAAGESLPDVESNRQRYEITCPTLGAGDALIFSAWMVHAAPPNRSSRPRIAMSTRWLGDDVRWRPHPAADPTVGVDDVTMAEGDPVSDDEHFPRVWPATEKI